MSLYGMMRTSISGMGAQENLLGTVSDNIANSNTTGYKRVSQEFSTLVVADAGLAYQSGSVDSKLRHDVGQQGTLRYSTSATDLAIVGDGFFVVDAPNGSTGLSRAGSFRTDQSGNLVNASGDRLLGYPSSNGGRATVNGLGGLVPVNIAALPLVAEPTTKGAFSMNLMATSDVSTAPLPSSNGAASASTASSSIVVYENIGTPVVLDIYQTKTAANTWEMSIFDRATASASGGFPYGSGPLAVTTLGFDPATGGLATTSAQSITMQIPNGNSIDLDLSGTTELPTASGLIDVRVDGSAPSPMDRVEITENGEVVAIYRNGASSKIFQIPLVQVVSPENLERLSGNRFGLTDAAGALAVGIPGEQGLGRTVSGAVEQSTVDVATELTVMIEAQKNYTANSKVFQTSAELMEVLINLKR
jgi:flagellar hook protein FlgE